MGTSDQGRHRRYHGSGDHQRGDRRRAGHRAGRAVFRNAGSRVYDRAAQHQRRPISALLPSAKCAGASSTIFAEGSARAQLVVECDEQREGEEHVTDTGHHEGFQYCRRAITSFGSR